MHYHVLVQLFQQKLGATNQIRDFDSTLPVLWAGHAISAVVGDDVCNN